jgi:hypothetical protein
MSDLISRTQALIDNPQFRVTDTVARLLLERIAELELSIKDLIEEFAEASCMGDLAKIARNYGYEESKDE